MKTMRRLLFAALFFLGMLPGTSGAQTMYTLPEIRAQVEARRHETYDVRDTQAEENLVLLTPDAEKMPVLKIQLSGDQPNLDALGEWSGREMTLEPYESEGYVKAFYRPLLTSPEGIDGWTVERYAGEMDEAEMLDGEFGKTLGDVWLEARHAASAVFGDDFELEFTAIWQTTSWREHQMRPAGDEWGAFVQVEKKIFNKEGSAYAQGYGYDVVFAAQTLCGIPLLANTNDGLLYEFDETGGVAVTATKREVSNVIAEDVPLCGIERIKESLRRQIEKEDVSTVRALRLGYGVFDDGTAFPCWVVYIDIGDPMTAGHGETAKWVFNAQTGERIQKQDMKKAPRIIR